MKLLIKYFLLLILAIFIGLAISMHSGYVLISYGETIIEMTLWIAIFFLLCGLLLVYGLLRSGTKLYNLPRTIAGFLQHYREAKSQRYFTKGMHRMLENDWSKAEDRFAHAISIQKTNTTTLTAYLTAAYAANKQHFYNKRDYYLDAAQKNYANNTKMALTIALARLHFFFNNQQYEEALALICHLRHNYPRHKLLLKKLYLIYIHQQDWRNLQLLFPRLSRYKILNKEELTTLNKKIYFELWLICLASKNDKKIKHFWRKLPRVLRHDADIADQYISYLETNNNSKQAEKILLHVLDKKWHAKLVARYGLLLSEKPWGQLKTAENWLKSHAQEPELLLTLCHICQRQQLIGKTKYYLDQYLKFAQKTAATYKHLGEFYEKLGDKEAALKYYRKGIELKN